MTFASAKLRPLPLGPARWTSGFWFDRFTTCRDNMVPTMGHLMTADQRVKFLGNFEVASGLVEGRHRGPKWNDGDFYKWLEAASSLLAFAPDPKLDAQLDQLIALIAKTQEPDGYIHTDVQIQHRAGENARRFGNPMDFEMYNMGHLITAGVVHHCSTGKSNLLTVARKVADFLAKEFSHPIPEQARHGICPSHLMALVDLYRTTNENKYLDLAAKLLNMRDLVTKGDDDNQDRIPFRQQTTAHGHAVRATYLYAGAADIYTETGDESLLKPLDLIWTDLTTKKLYITGGCGALFDGASPDGSEDQASITRVHQAFGRPYQLPHSTAHNETCAAIGNLLWNWRMFQITGEARFADLIEHTLYNSVLAGISLDGTSFFYTNTLRQLDPMPVNLRWPRHRQKVIGCFCCPPNVVRTIAQSSQYAYAQSDRGLHVALYGSSRLQASQITLLQETNYPWDGRIRITVESAPQGEFSLFLRIPSWTHNATIALGKDSPRPASAPNSFHEIRRTWSKGDTVELNLSMPARLIESHPLVEESRNHVAVARGPIIYCLESADLPRDVRLLDIHLPRTATFTPTSSPFPGITALKTTGTAILQGDWSTRLYRDFSPTQASEIPISFIPYFAWDNRPPGEMTVWVPLL